MNRRTTSINKRTSVAITGINNEIELDKSLWAINWFDLKRPNIYALYNLLVFPHLRNVGGRAHFKGYINKKIEGPDEVDRQMLLIVKYPNAEAFLKMLGNKLFLLKSVLRIKSVRKFIFGFTQRIGEQPAPPSKPARYIGKNFYLAHLFQGDQITSDDIQLLGPLLSQYNLVNYFSGLKAATISRTTSAGQEQVQPFFVDGLMVLEAGAPETFDLLLKDPVYDAFKKKCSVNSTYLVKRVI